MKKIASFLLTGFFAVTLFPSFSFAFSDVKSSHPYYKAISDLQARGIIGGYPDGSYKPEKAVTRAEAAKIIGGAAGLIGPMDAKISNSFKDVQGDTWYEDWVLLFKYNGVAQGYGDGTFGVAKNINLAETMKMVLKAYKIKMPEKAAKKPYSDVPADAWFAPYFAYAKENKILDADRSGNVNPSQNVTRGLLAEIIYLVLKLREETIPVLQEGKPDDALAKKSGQPDLVRKDVDRYLDVISFIVNSPILKKDRDVFYNKVKAEYQKDPSAAVQALKGMDQTLQQIFTTIANGVEGPFRAEMERLMRQAKDQGQAGEDVKYAIDLIDQYNETLAKGKSVNLTLRDAAAYVEYTQFYQSLMSGQEYELSDEMVPAVVGLITEIFKQADSATQNYMTQYKDQWSNLRLYWQYMDNSAQKEFKKSYLTFQKNQLAAQQKAYEEAQKMAKATVDTYQDMAARAWDQYNLNTYTAPAYTQDYLPQYSDYSAPDYSSGGGGYGEMDDSTYNTLRNVLLEDHASTMNLFETIDGNTDYYYDVVDY